MSTFHGRRIGAGVSRIVFFMCIAAMGQAVLPACAIADDGSASASSVVSPAATPDQGGSTRYGPWDLFDHRSQYGAGVYPEPFLVDDSDLEVNEFRFDWFHSEVHGERDNAMTTELEKGFGLVTLEAEVHYDYNTFDTFDFSSGRVVHEREQGFDNVDLGARAPVFQYVSADGFFDTTFGFGIEVGVPTNTPVSKDTEIVPKFFNDTRVGDHITVQTIIGYSVLLGSEADDSRTFEYGLVLGYTFPHEELPIPDVEQVIPVFELSGETAVNHADAGANALLGNAAIRFNLASVGPLQPRLGIGNVFPIDSGGRNSLRWGLYTSLVFEF